MQQKIKESWLTLLDKSAGKEYNVNCGNDTVYTSGGKVPSVLHRADQCVSMISPEPGRCGNIIKGIDTALVPKRRCQGNFKEDKIQ